MAAAAACALLAACGPPDPAREGREAGPATASATARGAGLAVLRGHTMGTTWSVRLPADPGAAERERIARRLEERLALLNARLSTWDPQSELSRFNATPGTAWQPVSRETAEVTALALDIAARSGGAFDPTVAPLVALWGFGPGERRAAPPPDAAIERVRARTGFGALAVRLDPPALARRVPGVEVELSAIAKGHGADVLAEELAALGHPDALVEIGGEIRARGRGPGGRRWRIGVESPGGITAPGTTATEAGDGRVSTTIPVTDAGIATSGDYRNYFMYEGVRYSHLLDPRSGRPVSHALAAVTVVAGTAALADAWATALLILGPTAGPEMAEAQGIAALFSRRIETSGRGERFESHASSAMQRLLPGG